MARDNEAEPKWLDPRQREDRRRALGIRRLLLDAVAGFAARTALAGGISGGAAERYWSVVRS